MRYSLGYSTERRQDSDQDRAAQLGQHHTVLSAVQYVMFCRMQLCLAVVMTVLLCSFADGADHKYQTLELLFALLSMGATIIFVHVCNPHLLNCTAL